MTRTNALFSFKEFLAANKGKHLGPADYIHAAFKLGNLPADLALSFAKILLPKFRIVEGRAFLEGSFDEDTYARYTSEGRTNNEIQLWMNLIEVTSLFENADIEIALEIANAMATIWNCQLTESFSPEVGKARVIYERDQNEVYVTVDVPD